MMVCTEPLPNERVPITVARRSSCSAPATISEAEAEPPLISTMSGLPLVRSPARALNRCVSSAGGRGGHDLALLQEGIGDGDRLIEQSAGVVAQVDDEALRLGLGREIVVELGDADKADIVAFESRAHRPHLDAGTGDGDLDRLLLALAHDLE